MKTSLLGTACLSLMLSACSGLPANFLPFGEKKVPDRSAAPADATKFRCSGGKRFYVRYLDDGAAAWLILTDREMRLDKIAGDMRYSNGIAILAVNGNAATLKDGPAGSYADCTLAARGDK